MISVVNDIESFLDGVKIGLVVWLVLVFMILYVLEWEDIVNN